MTDIGSITLAATAGMKDFTQRVYGRIKATGDERFSYTDINSAVFANGEIKPVVQETVRKKEVYLFHAFPDPNVSYMELFLAIDALSRASASSIHLILPYMPYQRQDRKDEPRAPISAGVIAQFIQTFPSVVRITTMDMHSPQMESAYRIPIDNLTAGTTVFKEYFKQQGINANDSLFASPDASGLDRAYKAAAVIDPDISLGFTAKRRTGPNKVKVLKYSGDDPNGKNVVLLDDILDTCNTMLKSREKIMEEGARSVIGVGTHGLFNDGAEEKMRKAGFKAIVTESIQRSPEYLEANKDWLTVLPLDKLFAEAIQQSSIIGGSISSLLKKY